MIGVLAIIAILAVVILPKVYSTIAASRVTTVIASINSLKTVISDFAGKYGAIPLTNNNSRVDDLLFTAGFLDGPFKAGIGNPPPKPPIPSAAWTYTNGAWAATGGASQTTQARIICANSNTNVPTNGNNYRLNGATDLPAGSRIISAVLPGVRGPEARELSVRIDGDGLSAATNTLADNTGKVVYAAPNNAGVTTVYIYITHQ
jgi:type II secretory pathway pseudopilin PulG